ncbi:unnamed protein product [Trichogramma brassicae]|uniref:Uncharacterized protein n=1 Tax=Trichogramma brassicae TaxID=86971 RepID=A0A6H5IZG8_9HYME|nr:unnamed protein product [Trichogramma brassicae]
MSKRNAQAEESVPMPIVKKMKMDNSIQYTEIGSLASEIKRASHSMRSGSAWSAHTHGIRNQTAREYRRVKRSRKAVERGSVGLGRWSWRSCVAAELSCVVREEAVWQRLGVVVRSCVCSRGSCVVSVKKLCSSLEFSAAREVLRRDEAIREARKEASQVNLLYSDIFINRPRHLRDKSSTILDRIRTARTMQLGTAESESEERRPRNRGNEEIRS